MQVGGAFRPDHCLLGFVNTRIQVMLPKWSGDKGIILVLVNNQKPFFLLASKQS